MTIRKAYMMIIVGVFELINNEVDDDQNDNEGQTLDGLIEPVARTRRHLQGRNEKCTDQMANNPESW